MSDYDFDIQSVTPTSVVETIEVCRSLFRASELRPAQLTGHMTVGVNNIVVVKDVVGIDQLSIRLEAGQSWSDSGRSEERTSRS